MTLKNQQQRAIAEFDEKFPSHISMNHGLRNFISSLLTRTRCEVIEEVIDAANTQPPYRQTIADFLSVLRAMQEESSEKVV